MIFKDKVYDEMDDISRLIEPYEYSVNAEISQMPEEIEITAEDLINMKMYGRGLSPSSILIKTAKELNLLALASSFRNGSYYKFYSPTIIPNFEDEVPIGIFNVDDKTMTHRIVLKKIKDSYDEKELQVLAVEFIAEHFRSLEYIPASKIDKSRLNELAQLFNCPESMKERSSSKKIRLLRTKVTTMMKDGSLDIRDIDLANRFGNWFKLYVLDGNLPALTNLTKIKIVSHNKRPIYSIEEEVCA